MPTEQLVSRGLRFLRDAALGPLPLLRRRHMPILGTYLGYGAISYIGVAESEWARQSLMTPAELAGLGAWLGLPWAVKMVMGQLVDSATLFGSARRGWLLAGSTLVAIGLLLHAGNVSGALPQVAPKLLYLVAGFAVVVGIVLQDVVADALTAEIVPRWRPDGSPRPQREIIEELAMVQVMGRFTLLASTLVFGILASLAAQQLPATWVFLTGLAIPCLTATAAVVGEIPQPARGPLDWAMLAGGAVIAAMTFMQGGLLSSWGAESHFLVSALVVALLLHRVSKELEPAARRTAFLLAVLIFVFRAQPSLGEGYIWYSIDVLKFDAAFLAGLVQISGTLGVAGLWAMCRVIARNNQTRVLLWLVWIGPLLALPLLALVFGLHAWTEPYGVGAREIARLDTSLELRIDNLSMIAMLTLTAFYAPPGRTATWFTLMASLMNLALSAGSLAGKYLNLLFTVQRGDYSQLPMLALTTVVIAAAVPWAVAALLGRRLA